VVMRLSQGIPAVCDDSSEVQNNGCRIVRSTPAMMASGAWFPLGCPSLSQCHRVTALPRIEEKCFSELSLNDVLHEQYTLSMGYTHARS